jgi:hypothetical protein
MADLILVLSIFAVGAGCGYYVRDLISKKRRERYLKSKQSKRSRNTIGSYSPLACEVEPFGLRQP